MVSLALVQRGGFHLAPRDIVQPLPPLPPKAEQVYRGPIFVEPVPVRVVQATTAREATIQAAPTRTRPRTTSGAVKPKHKFAQDEAVEPALKAVSLPEETCEGMEGMDLARCMRPHILDADLQLRTAYDDAARAGVKRRELVAHRRQWSKLRKRANSDPRRVLAGFREIAQQLDVARAGMNPEDSECGFAGGVCVGPDDQ